MKIFENYFKEIVIYFGVLIIVLIAYCGWHPGLTLGSYDLLSGHIMTMARFILNGGVENSIYDFYISGGSEVFPVTGILPIQELLLNVTTSPFWIVNLTVLTILLLNGLLLRSLFKESYNFLFHKKLNINSYQDILLAVVLIFIPCLGWRINHGHINILNGVIAYVLCTLVPLKIYNGNFSAKSFALIAISLAHVLPYSSFQMVVYALFFSLPIFSFIVFKIIKEKKFSGWIYGVSSLVVGILMASPTIYIMFDYFLSGKSQRSIGERAIFSYLKPSYDYLISSLSLARSSIPTKYPPFSHHEINYSIGYLLLIIFAYAIFKAIKNKFHFIFPTLVTSVAILMFCFNILGVTDLFISVFSMLKAFRVPYRALIFININLLIGSLLVIFKDLGEITYKEVLAVVILSFISILIPTHILEILAVVCLVACFIAQTQLKLVKVAPIALILLSTLSIKAFSERAVDFENIDELKTRLSRYKNNELDGSKLFKTLNYASFSRIGGNALLFNNSSVINSYWHPNKDFNKSYSAVFGLPYSSTRLSFKFDYKDTYYPTFQALYAIRNIAYFSKQAPDKLQILKKDDLRNIWSPQNVIELSSQKKVFSAIRNQGQGLIATLDKNLYVSKGKTNLNKSTFNKCINKSVKGISKGTLTLQIDKGEDCLIVLPINFSNYLVVRNSSGQELEKIKANGSLLGFLVPSGSAEIKIRGESKPPSILIILKILSYLTILGLFIYEVRKQKNELE